MGAAVPLSVEGGAAWVPHIYNSLVSSEAYLFTKWHLDRSTQPFDHYRHGQKVGGAVVPPFGLGSWVPIYHSEVSSLI